MSAPLRFSAWWSEEGEIGPEFQTKSIAGLVEHFNLAHIEKRVAQVCAQAEGSPNRPVGIADDLPGKPRSLVIVANEPHRT